MPIRKARITDVRPIKKLIDDYMLEGFMLPRPLSELYENIRDFFVLEEDGGIQGNVGLHIVWEDLAEIKSLVIGKPHRKQGLGKLLIDTCLEEAKKLGVKRVFALTKIPEFFIKLGFIELDKSELPHKVWAECIKCPKFPECDEIAVCYFLKDEDAPAEIGQ
ncbi:MAG: N-acetyltransferase [bacterium]|jgi:amino-acid N-acetyltransferase|nr:N-acetyltransferase [bacterium]